MTTYDHVLEGCAPVPLAGYLKALGVFRIIAEQADERARGFWRDERFVLRARLTKDELIQFFTDTYKPSPVVAPWNAGSGFWTKGKREGYNAIKQGVGERLLHYRNTIQICEEKIQALSLKDAPKETNKARFVNDLRACLVDDACRWLDGAIALTTDGPRYPPILGTGGNDGRLDFSNNFMRRLTQVLDNDGKIHEAALRASLYCEPAAGLEKGAVGQFDPGGAGGANTGVGFESDSYVNPWSFILIVEGALAFASATVRRLANDRKTVLSFPFTTRAVGAGAGATAFADEADARAEFWAPVWSRPASQDELSHLLAEGRAVLRDGETRDGLDFARAVGELGFARGIDSFNRFGFLMRSGKAFLATPLARVKVKENQRVDLISEMHAAGWLSRAREITRYDVKDGMIDRSRKAPARLIQIGQRLDEGLFDLAVESSPATVQNVLGVLGQLMFEVARRPKLREAQKGRRPLTPPPRLSGKWAEAADDGSFEFALAEALASLNAAAEDFRLPFRRHLAPVDWPKGRPKGREEWSDTTDTKVLAVWTGRDLVRDMASLLERRLLESNRRKFTIRQGATELPLTGRRDAPLTAVAAFLAGRTDDNRIAALAAGLAWARSRSGPASTPEREDPLPFAYAALKPLFAPRGVGADPNEPHSIDPLPLVRLLRAGRIADALTRAQHLARGAGMPTPFGRPAVASTLDPERLAAALLFPIAPAAHERLIARAWPDLRKDQENHSDH